MGQGVLTGIFAAEPNAFPYGFKVGTVTVTLSMHGAWEVYKYNIDFWNGAR